MLNKHHAWIFTGLLRAQNKSLDPNPLKLWGIWNLDPDLKLVVGLPSLGFQLGVRFINTSATAFFCFTPPWIMSYCYEIKLDLTTSGNRTEFTHITSHTFLLSHFWVKYTVGDSCLYIYIYVHGAHSPGMKHGSAMVGGGEIKQDKDSAEAHKQKVFKSGCKNSSASSTKRSPPAPVQQAHTADSTACYKPRHIHLEMFSLMSSSLKIQLLSFACHSEQAGVTHLRFHQAKCFCAVNEIINILT